MLAVVLGLSSARAQQDIDLAGYTLVFQDNFDTLVGGGLTDDKGDDTLGTSWASRMGAPALSLGEPLGQRVDNGECPERRPRFNTAEWNRSRQDQFLVRITGKAVASARWIGGATALHSGLATGARRSRCRTRGKERGVRSGSPPRAEFRTVGTKGYEIDIVEAYGGQFKEAPGGDKYNSGRPSLAMLMVARRHNLTKAENGTTFQAAMQSINGTSTAAR